MKRLATLTLTFLALSALAPGCKVKTGERGAAAATDDGGKPGKHGKRGGKSSATGEYQGLRTGKIEKGDVVVNLPAVGTLAPVTKVEVKSVLSGRVVALHVREGDHVEPGQALATLEPGIDQLRELSAISSGVSKAQLELKDAQVDLDNTNALAAKGFASNDQVKSAQKRVDQAQIDYAAAVAQEKALAKSGVPMGNAARALKSFDVTAPAAGIVVDRLVEVGEVCSSGISGFNQGTVLFEIADLGELQVELFVNEVDVGKLAQDAEATVTVDAFRGKKWKGTVHHIAPQARKEGEIRGFDVEIRLDLAGNPGLLRPGMTANVDITGDSKSDVTRAPIESLYKLKGDDVVYVIKEGKPEAVPVGVGLVSLEWIEITDGVDVGTEVALQQPDRFLEEKRDRGRRR